MCPSPLHVALCTGKFTNGAEVAPQNCNFTGTGASGTVKKCCPLAGPQLGSCASSGCAWRLRAARRAQCEAQPSSTASGARAGHVADFHTAPGPEHSRRGHARLRAKELTTRHARPSVSLDSVGPSLTSPPGAYTGEMAVDQMADMGIKCVLRLQRRPRP